MKLRTSFAIAAVLLTPIAVVSAQTATTVADVDRFSASMKIETLAALKNTRESIKAQASALQWLLGYLQSKSLQKQIDDKLPKVIPEVQAALNNTPAECALVSILVDKPILGSGPPLVRAITFEGIGDTAAKVIARNVVSSDGYTISAAAPEGYTYDDGSSHLLCFALDGGTLKAKEVYMPLIRSSVATAVQDLKKAEAEQKKEEERRKAAAADAAIKNAEAAKKQAEESMKRIEEARKAAAAAAAAAIPKPPIIIPPIRPPAPPPLPPQPPKPPIRIPLPPPR